MCGRFVLKSSPREFANHFNARIAPVLTESYEPSYNVAPTDQVLGIVDGRDGDRMLDVYRWGLIPFWSKDPAIGNRAFNARTESVATKLTFRHAFKSRRIAVPADGYWEWRKDSGKLRQPFYLHRADDRPIVFAGLYESWHDTRSGVEPETRIRSCTIITTDASTDLRSIHDRMPVILDEQILDVWLDRDNDDQEELLSLLRPAPVGSIAYYPVDRRVGNVRNNDRQLLNAIGTDENLVGSPDS